MNENKLNLPVLASGVGVGLLGRFAGRLVAALTSIFVARFLGPSAFGLYAIGIVVLRLSEVIIPLGFDLGVIKFGADFADEKMKVKGVILHSLFFSFGLSLLVSLLIWSFSPLLSTHLFKQPELQIVLRYVSLIIPMLVLLTLAAAATRVSQNMKYSFFTQDVGQPMISLLAMFAFVGLGWGLKGVLLAEVISVLISATLALIFLIYVFPFLAKSSISIIAPPHEFYRFSITSSFSVVFITLMFWADRIILGVYVSPGDLGIYQAAAQASVIFAVLLSGMNRIITPLFANLSNKAGFQQVNELFIIGTKWALYLSIPLFVILFSQPLNIMVGLYGEQFSSGVLVLTILLVGQSVNLVTGSVGPLLNIAGYQTHLMLFSGLALVINIGSDISLVPKYGIVGAAVSMSFALSAYYLALLIFARLKLGVWPFDKRYIKVVFATLLCLGVSVALGMLLEQISLAAVLGELAFLYAIFFVVIFLFGIDREDHVFISMMGSFLQRRFPYEKI